MSTIQIKGLDKLRIKFENVEPGIKAGIKAATLHVKGKVAKYPPATGANEPKTTFTSKGNNTWYQRGWGSKWALKKGSWHGRKSSENLGRKWTVEYRNSGLTGVVGNNVSYGKYVQGADEQASALKRIGWQTTADVAEQEAETVTNFIKHQIDISLSK